MTDARKIAVTLLVEAHVRRLSAGDELLSEISYFQRKLEEDSLKQRVDDAVSFRRQGHFDKAMLGISEANRDQVTALRKIQSLLARVDNEPYPVPVFEKFRQHDSLEIGLSNAAPVLQLLGDLSEQCNPEINHAISSFHELEGKIRDESGYIEFLQKKRATDSELKNAQADRNDLLLDADEVRAAILKSIFMIIDVRSENLEPSRASSLLFLELAENLFQVITSSVATKHSFDVEVS